MLTEGPTLKRFRPRAQGRAQVRLTNVRFHIANRRVTVKKKLKKL